MKIVLSIIVNVSVPEKIYDSCNLMVISLKSTANFTLFQAMVEKKIEHLELYMWKEH